ncbi:hypothetical protein GCM10010440_71430 [Kitasatospora cinereorecta]
MRGLTANGTHLITAKRFRETDFSAVKRVSRVRTGGVGVKSEGFRGAPTVPGSFSTGPGGEGGPVHRPEGAVGRPAAGPDAVLGVPHTGPDRRWPAGEA